MTQYRLDRSMERMGPYKTILFAPPFFASNVVLSTTDPAVVKHILMDQFDKYTKSEALSFFYFLKVCF